MHQSELIPFFQGPPICVTIDLNPMKATLSFSKRFECKMIGDADASQKNILLEFLESYGNGKRLGINLPLDHLTAFRKKVLENLQTIAFGEIITYGELAEKAGSPRAARAVGSACHYNPFPLFIPCHRVVASGNKTGGFAYGSKMKHLLLDFEGWK